MKFGTFERFGGVGICERGREKNGRMCVVWLRQDPPLDLSFWSFLTFLHHGIEEVERHLL